jgi:predicted ATPase
LASYEPGPLSVSGMPLGGLAGRAAEAATIQRMVGRSRLVTITGMPGVGKTAVAIAAAAAMSGSFADGAWLVTLDSLPDGELLPQAIADALKVPDLLTTTRLDALVDELSDRRLLLVLDTCEHLIWACGSLAMRLLPCPGVRILATSREPLRAPGGLTVTVRPLALRDAMQMFSERAAEAAPGFRLTRENREAVAAICRRLDRLPLAIDLAARELAGGSLDQLSSRLVEDLWFLQNSAEAPARHQTLRAAIGWSHELCTPAERLLWARLSVFPGPFQLQDAEEVCADGLLPVQAIGAGVSTLAARSIVAMDLQAGGWPPFMLPTTIRAFGAEMLRQLGDESWQRRYKAWRQGRGGG